MHPPASVGREGYGATRPDVTNFLGGRAGMGDGRGGEIGSPLGPLGIQRVAELGGGVLAVRGGTMDVGPLQVAAPAGELRGRDEIGLGARLAAGLAPPKMVPTVPDQAGDAVGVAAFRGHETESGRTVVAMDRGTRTVL